MPNDAVVAHEVPGKERGILHTQSSENAVIRKVALRLLPFLCFSTWSPSSIALTSASQRSR